MTQQISRHRAAMGRHRRTSNLLTAAATALGLLAVGFAVRGSIAPFGLMIITSVFMGAAAGRAHRDYRRVRSRVLQTEHGHVGGVVRDRPEPLLPPRHRAARGLAYRCRP
ncbi:hypothetical protein ACIQUY_29385 [Streptomyces sp. NPDC090231]|uniref:hypothetical protein n=1 Tax=unclassified Streptomyces TaxID=2593676 RepID=UPI00381F8C6D